MNHIDYVIFLHRLYFDGRPKKGGVDFVLDELVRQNKTLLVVAPPLDYSLEKNTFVTLVSKKNEKVLKVYRTFVGNKVLNWCHELLFFIFYLSKRANREAIKGKMCITADPLAAVGALFFRKLGIFKYLYFHLTDYSIKRFDSILLNFIYRTALKEALRHSDLVGCVSKRAQEEVISLGASHTHYIPNTRDFESLALYRKPVNKRNKYSLVTSCAYIAPKYQVLEIVGVVAKLVKKYPRVHLKIVGGLTMYPDYVEKIKKYIKKYHLEKNVTFVGYVSREESTRLVGESYLVIAIYGNEDTHVFMGDSLKVREAAALGVPVIMNSVVVSTAKELSEFKAGIVVDSTSEVYSEIEKLFNDNSLYEDLSRNSLVWSKKFDKRILLRNLFKEFAS